MLNSGLRPLQRPLSRTQEVMTSFSYSDFEGKNKEEGEDMCFSLTRCASIARKKGIL